MQTKMQDLNPYRTRRIHKIQLCRSFNSFIQKPLHWFALQINQWAGFCMIGITIRRELKSHPLLVATPQSFEKKKKGHGNFYYRKNGRYWFRSSHEKGVPLKDVLRNFAKFTGKYLCQGIFFNKGACLKPASLSKKGLWHRCFSVD